MQDSSGLNGRHRPKPLWQLYGKIAFATSSQSGDNSTVHCGRHCSPQVIARPRLQASAFTQGEPVKRVRLVSTKLQDGFTIDELFEEATVLDLKKLVQAHFAKNVTYFAQNKSAGDERSGTMAVDACDQLVSLGSAGAKKGVLKVQKVCDEEEGLVLETDVAQLQLGLESFNIIFEGRVLPEESTLEACGLINNERLVLDFRWPWDAGDDGKDSSGKGKGDKKAPAKKKK